MKIILSIFCSLCYLSGCSQPKPSGKFITVSELGSLVSRKTSQADVKKTFRGSAQQTITPIETLWEYRNGGSVYALQFDKDKKLTRLSFINKKPASSPNLSYGKVKAIKTAYTKKEILAAFGQPEQLDATAVEESWYYSFVGEGGSRGLVITFNQANVGRIKHFSYSEEVQRETNLTSVTPNPFNVGTTTSSEVEAVLGLPSKLTIESKGGERWYFHSQTATLVIAFDDQSKLSEFTFQHNAD